MLYSPLNLAGKRNCHLSLLVPWGWEPPPLPLRKNKKLLTTTGPLHRALPLALPDMQLLTTTGPFHRGLPLALPDMPTVARCQCPSEIDTCTNNHSKSTVEQCWPPLRVRKNWTAVWAGGPPRSYTYTRKNFTLQYVVCNPAEQGGR